MASGRGRVQPAASGRRVESAAAPSCRTVTSVEETPTQLGAVPIAPSHTPPAPHPGSRRTRLARRLAPLVAIVVLVACADQERRERAGSSAEDRPSVVASVFPVADLAAAVGGGDVQVSTLLPPGASPATFDVTPEVMRRVRRARLVVLVGGGLDPWAEDLAEGGGSRSVRLLEGLALRSSGDAPGTGNPHLWLDPIRTRDELVPRIAEALSAAVPALRDRFLDRAAALADSLTSLDREIRRSLEPLEARSFVASHPAWLYYAERYGLQQVGVAHEHPGREPSARAIARLLDRAREAEVGAVFREPQIAEAGARSLAEELGVPLLVLDPLGGAEVEGRDSYQALLRYNTAQFVRGLGGSAATR